METEGSGFTKTNVCPKTCGSKSCKGRVKLSTKEKPLCPGIGAGCIAAEEKSSVDRKIANQWLKTGNGDREWFKKSGGLMKVTGGHTDQSYFVK